MNSGDIKINRTSNMGQIIMTYNLPEMPSWFGEKRGFSLALSYLSALSSEIVYSILKDPNEYHKKWNLADK